MCAYHQDDTAIMAVLTEYYISQPDVIMTVMSKYNQAHYLIDTDGLIITLILTFTMNGSIVNIVFDVMIMSSFVASLVSQWLL